MRSHGSLGVGFVHEARAHEPGNHPVERARLRREAAGGLILHPLLHGVAVERAAREGKEDVVLERAHGWDRRMRIRVARRAVDDSPARKYAGGTYTGTPGRATIRARRGQSGVRFAPALPLSGRASRILRLSRPPTRRPSGRRAWIGIDPLGLWPGSDRPPARASPAARAGARGAGAAGS